MGVWGRMATQPSIIGGITYTPKPYDGNANVFPTASLPPTSLYFSGIATDDFSFFVWGPPSMPTTTGNPTAGTYSISVSWPFSFLFGTPSVISSKYISPAIGSFSATIDPKTLTANTSLLSASNITYNGDVTTTTSGSVTFDGLVGSDAITATVTGAVFSGPGAANAGTSKPVTVSLSASAGGGTLPTNYTIPTSTIVSANIDPKTLTANTSALSASNITYNGDVTTTTSGPVTFNGLVGSDAITATVTGAVFSGPGAANAGTSKPVTVSLSASASGGTLPSNYTIPTSTIVSANIDPKTLTANKSLLSASNITYNGDVTTTTSGPVTFNGLVGSDAITATVTGATFNNKDVGNGKTVTVTFSAAASGGTLPSNYNIPNSTTVQANITAAPLTVIDVTVDNKAPDGTPIMPTSGSATVVGPTFDGGPFTATVIASVPSASPGCYPVTGVVTLNGPGSTNFNATIVLNNACITGSPETPRTPIPDRYAEHGNSNVINDRKANAYAASRAIPQPLARPMDASTRTSLLRGATAVQR